MHLLWLDIHGRQHGMDRHFMYPICSPLHILHTLYLSWTALEEPHCIYSHKPWDTEDRDRTVWRLFCCWGGFWWWVGGMVAVFVCDMDSSVSTNRHYINNILYLVHVLALPFAFLEVHMHAYGVEQAWRR